MNGNQLRRLLASISNKINNNFKDLEESLKDYNKYILITNDDPLIIKVSDITDLTDVAITIDNLTGEFGTLVANEDGTYTYTLNTIMTDVETLVFKVDGIEQNVVIVPYREMIYNDDNGAITYTGTWTIDEDNNHYGGSAHYTSELLAKATFRFTGTNVDVYSRTNKGVGKIFATLKKVTKNEGGTESFKTIKNLGIDNQSVSGDYYQIPTLSFKDLNLDYGTYEVEISVVHAENDDNTIREMYYLDGIRVYNTLGDNLNESINNLYQVKDTNPSVLYTDRRNRKFLPTREYDPATKKYVDDIIATNKTNICTDEEVDTVLLNIFGGDYSGNQ